MRKNWLWIASFIVVLLIFHISYGFETLVPTNISWLMTAMHDWGTHYLSFYFYKTEPWHFPLGAVHNYFYPIGTNVGFTDSIPLLAIFFKLFAKILPEDFQYFGLWLLLCHLLAAYFTIRLFNHFKVKSLYTFFAVIFIAANPVLIYRGLHPSLCAHWLLIACIYLYFRSSSTNKTNKVLLNQFLLLIISAAINPYLCFMVLGFTLAIPLKLTFLDHVLKIKTFFFYLAGSLLGLLIVWYFIGLIDFSGNEDLGVSGAYGLYSLNLNALYNPSGYSTLLPGLKQVSWHQYEGFMYLGVGMLLLITVVLLLKMIQVIKTKQPLLSGKIWASRLKSPLLILSILFTIFSMTHIVSINDKILFQVPIPKQLIKLGDVFRASARFFWTPYYLLLFSSIIVLTRLKLAEGFKIIILSSILFIQLYDTKPLLTSRSLSFGTYEPPLSKNWQALIKQFDEVVFYPPFQASHKTDLDYQYFSFLAAKARKEINIGYVARANNKLISLMTDSLNKTLADGYLSPKALYVTTATHLKAFGICLETQTGQLNTLDGYYYLFSKELTNESLINLSNRLNSQNKQLLDSGFAAIGKRILFEPQKELVSEDGKINFSIARIRDEDKYLSLDGWAFVEGTKNNSGDSIFFTIEKENKFYLAPANIFKRPDISSHFNSLLDDAGFSTIIFKDSVEKGEYRLGIVIKSKTGEIAKQATDQVIKVNSIRYMTPRKVFELPKNEDAPINYGIDLLENKSNFFDLRGWGAIKNIDATNSRITVILKNKESTYELEVEPVSRPDLTTYFRNSKDFSNAGFNCRILKRTLPKAKYQIGILIQNRVSNKKSLVFTDKELEVF